MDEALTATIRRVHRDSRGTYGAPRVLAELRLGLGVHVGKKRVARLMGLAELTGVSHRRKRRGWKPDTATHEDLVKRQFRSDAPDRLWFCDITQHRARDGWVYCAAVIDAFSRRIVGWSISDRITAEIVVDALEMARWRRRPTPGTIVHADRLNLVNFEVESSCALLPAITWSDPWAESPPAATTPRWNRSSACYGTTSSTAAPGPTERNYESRSLPGSRGPTTADAGNSD